MNQMLTWRVTIRDMKCLPFFAALTLLAGCGGGGSSPQFGTNSEVSVQLFSTRIDDLQLIVSPKQQSPDSASACRETNDGFGCQQDLYNDATVYYFRTNSDASSRPFHVYVRNTSSRTIRFVLDIYMDEELKFSLGYDSYDRETIWMARIFRNNADYPDRSREGRYLKDKEERAKWLAGEDVGSPITTP